MVTNNNTKWHPKAVKAGQTINGRKSVEDSSLSKKDRLHQPSLWGKARFEQVRQEVRVGL